MDSKDKKINISKFKHFRKVSIYFYLMSFFFVTVFFIFYLYASKNNRSCQYGSTLYCNSENFYYVSGTDGKFNQIIFQNSTLTTSTTIQYPYNSTPDYYNIDYFFGISGGVSVTNVNNNIGLSFRNVGASIYFNQDAPYLANDLSNWTRFIISQSNISSFEILEPVKNSTAGLFEYYYINQDNNDISPIIPGSVSNFYSTETPEWENVGPVKSNWMNLLKNNQTQHRAGCSVGNLSGCACIDPGYISNIKCNDYIINPNSGLYCPPDNLNCTIPCSEIVSTNCGYRFCSVGNNVDPSEINTQNNTNPDGLTQIGQKGFYQNSIIPGMKNANDPTNYTIGVNGSQLTGALGIPNNNFQLRSTTNGFAGYPSLQSRNFCGGTSPTKNNFNDDTDSNPKFSEHVSDNYNPQFATFARFDENNKFNF